MAAIEPSFGVSPEMLPWSLRERWFLDWCWSCCGEPTWYRANSDPNWRPGPRHAQDADIHPAPASEQVRCFACERARPARSTASISAPWKAPEIRMLGLPVSQGSPLFSGTLKWTIVVLSQRLGDAGRERHAFRSITAEQANRGSARGDTARCRRTRRRHRRWHAPHSWRARLGIGYQSNLPHWRGTNLIWPARPAAGSPTHEPRVRRWP